MSTLPTLLRFPVVRVVETEGHDDGPQYSISVNRYNVLESWVPHNTGHTSDHFKLFMGVSVCSIGKYGIPS